MIAKLLFSLMCISQIESLRFPPVTSAQLRRNVTQGQALPSSVTKTAGEVINKSILPAGNNQTIRAHYPSTTGRYQPTSRKNQPTTGRYQPTSGRYQPTTGRYQPTTGKHQPTTGRYQPTTGKNQPTTGRYQPTSRRYRPTTGRYQPTTGRNQPTTGRYQPTTGRYQPTTGKHQPTSGKYSTPALLHDASTFAHRELNTARVTHHISNTDTLIVTDQEFLCNDGKFIILSSQKCDGWIDCPDSSDELPDLCQTVSPNDHKCKSDEMQCPESGECIHINKVEFSDTKCWGIRGPDKDDLKRYCTGPNLLCDNGTKCVPAEKICNKVYDCLDKLDERNSPWGYQDKGSSFKCANGYCISEVLLCNGLNNCGDASDEANEMCEANARRCNSGHFSSGKFVCNNGLCVEKSVVGNGKDDCGDNSDESGMMSQSNSCSEFLCKNGKCIHRNNVCNGHDDCGDHSDEDACPNVGRITRQPDYHVCSGHTCPSGVCLDGSKFCNGIDDCGDSSDERGCGDISSTWVWSDQKSLIITASVLGTAVLLIIGVVVAFIMYSRKKQKKISRQRRSTLDFSPPAYWQAVGVVAPSGPGERSQPAELDRSNPLFSGLAVLPE